MVAAQPVPPFFPPQAGLPQMPKVFGLKPRKNYLPWSHAEERLARSRNYWICTVRPNGRPHATPVWGFWLEGALYFGTARSSRKALNLAHNANLSVHLESGDDVVILEGAAAEVSEKEEFQRLDAASRKKYQMPLLIIPGESVVYRVRPRVVLAWLESDLPGSGTRWQFPVAAGENR